MVKMKKAALGAFGMASLNALGVGSGENGNEAPHQIIQVDDHANEPLKRSLTKKKRSTTSSSVKDLKEKAASEDKDTSAKASSSTDVFKHRRRLKASSGSEKNSDVIFLVGEEPDIQRIPAHSWILIKGSPVFRAMFRSPLSPVNSINKSNNKGSTPVNVSDDPIPRASKVEEATQLEPVIENEEQLQHELFDTVRRTQEHNFSMHRHAFMTSISAIFLKEKTFGKSVKMGAPGLGLKRLKRVICFSSGSKEKHHISIFLKRRNERGVSSESMVILLGPRCCCSVSLFLSH